MPSNAAPPAGGGLRPRAPAMRRGTDAITGRLSAGGDPHQAPPGAKYRYGSVFALISCAVVFAIVSPEGRLPRAVAFAIVGIALLVAVGTSREPTSVRRHRAIIGGIVTAVLTVGIVAGLVPRPETLVLSALVTFAIPVTLVTGLLRLVRERGATLQAVAGALAIYLLVGLTFASVIGFVAAVGSGQYFVQNASASTSARVYFSFSVLTTTGFGDLTAAGRVGRALAVIEMLVGQLYLVTVIGILIGRRVGTVR